MKKLTLEKPELFKILVYTAIVLLVMNLLLAFLPFMKIYQPSYSETVLGVTTYKGWYTSSAPMVAFILPIFVTVIPYIATLISFLPRIRKRNLFVKMLNKTYKKPLRFRALKFAGIANLCVAWWATLQSIEAVGPYVKHGAYFKITFFGVMNLICTVVFVVVLFILSRLSKRDFAAIVRQRVAQEQAQALQNNAGDET